MSKTRVDNQAPTHKYFTQMLNIAEDDLDPFQYRLLAHYVRWTGHGNETDESIRIAAKATRMGVNKIRSTLDELVSMGYIAVERPTPQEARNGKTIHITILDRWMDNISRYQKGVSNPIQDNARPVSNTTHTPVSNTIRLEERGTERIKNSAKAPTYPKSIKSYTVEHIRTYQQQHAVDMVALIHAWDGDMYSSITEFATKIGRMYIEVHQELTRLNKPSTEYVTLANFTKKKDAWKDNRFVTDMLLYVTNCPPAPKPQDKSDKQMTEAEYILSQLQGEGGVYGRAS